MNQRRKFTEDFKQEAAAQVIERGYPIRAEVDLFARASDAVFE